jgi:hypothetical protein
MNRKEFIITGSRMLILAGMAATTGYLVVNNKIDTTCSKSAACTKCGEFSGCELPLAQDTRQKENLNREAL